MKNLLQILVFMALMMVVGTASAFTVPSPTGYVTDTTGSLTPSQTQSLNRRLTDYQRTTKNEIAVLLIQSLNGDDIDDVSQKVFQTYKVGKSGLDNGVLLLIAVRDHKMRLQTGKGVEGDLTDIQSNDILASMRPFLRKGDYAGGIGTALDQVESKLENRSTQKADPGTGQAFNAPVAVQPDTPVEKTETPSSWGNEIGFGFGIVGLFVALVLLARHLIRRKAHRDMQDLEASVNEQIEFEKSIREKVASVSTPEVQHVSVSVPPEPVVVPVAPVRARTVSVPTPAPVVDPALEAARRADRLRREREALEEAREEERAEARRRRLRAEEEAIAAAAVTTAVVVSMWDNDDSSSSSDSDSGSSDDSGGSDWGGGSDSGFGGGDSGGGGSSSDW